MRGGLVEIGETLVWSVRGAVEHRAMQLPAVEPRDAAQHREHLRTSALPRTVVEHGDARSERGQRREIGGVRPAMMRHEVHIHRSDEIARTREIEQRGSCEISDVEESKSAELDQHAGRPRILDDFLRRAGGVPACGIPAAGARQRLGDRPAAAAHDDGVDAAHGQSIAVGRQMPPFARGLVVLEQRQRRDVLPASAGTSPWSMNVPIGSAARAP